MEILLLTIVALPLLTAAAYVQKRIPAYTKGSVKIMMARAMLILIGIAFGMTIATYAAGRVQQWLLFFSGFGIVHVPAAMILFIKSRRGEGKS